MERYVKAIDGVDVLFVRIGSILAYFFNLDGKEYGNSAGLNGKSIEIDNNIKDIIKEIADLKESLEQNAKETIAKYRQ